jgi:hypothetical protein
MKLLLIVPMGRMIRRCQRNDLSLLNLPGVPQFVKPEDDTHLSIDAAISNNIPLTKIPSVSAEVMFVMVENW